MAMANSGSREHIPRDIEEKWKTEISVKMSKVLMGKSHSQLFTNRNSSRNRGLTGEHSSKAEEGWQTMAWDIYYPPVHWKKAL